MRAYGLLAGIFCLLIIMFACNGTATDNRYPPLAANAGADVTVNLGTGDIQLDGSGSRGNPANNRLYHWRLTGAPKGSHAYVDKPEQEQAHLTPDLAGLYELQLTVFENGKSDSDSMKVRVNSPPSAIIQSRRGTTEQGLFILDATASIDPDHDNLSYHWTVVNQPSGVQLHRANRALASMHVDPSINSVKLTLTVSDGLLIDRKTVVIEAGAYASTGEERVEGD